MVSENLFWFCKWQLNKFRIDWNKCMKFKLIWMHWFRVVCMRERERGLLSIYIQHFSCFGYLFYDRHLTIVTIHKWIFRSKIQFIWRIDNMPPVCVCVDWCMCMCLFIWNGLSEMYRLMHTHTSFELNGIGATHHQCFAQCTRTPKIIQMLNKCTNISWMSYYIRRTVICYTSWQAMVMK